MKHKDKQEPKEEKTGQGEGEMADFYGLLESLLPLKSELLQDFRAALEDCSKRSKETLPRDKNETNYALELEKEKTKCLFELLRVALDQYLRVGADYANYQKRVPRQTADAIAYEKEKIIRTLLPVLDNFESALGGLQNAHSAEGAGGVVKGVNITYDHLSDILKSHGVEQIKALGEKFDPSLHEAIMQKNECDKEEGVVLEELGKGYKLNGRVIRPSKVVVNRVTSLKPAEQPAEGRPTEQTAKGEKTTDTE
jgi:molecular chaperone GrpE